jgi:hypothetical protein
MKKNNTSKKSPVQKTDKGKETGELRKPAKLKPLKEKEKKNWKQNLEDDEEDDFAMEAEDMKLGNDFDDDEEEDAEFFDDTF